jgi:hypothetical protein
MFRQPLRIQAVVGGYSKDSLDILWMNIEQEFLVFSGGQGERILRIFCVYSREIVRE